MSFSHKRSGFCPRTAGRIMRCGLGAQQGVAAPVRCIRGQKRRSRSIDLSSEGAVDMLLDKQPTLHLSEQQDDSVTLKRTLTLM